MSAADRTGRGGDLGLADFLLQSGVTGPTHRPLRRRFNLMVGKPFPAILLLFFLGWGVLGATATEPAPRRRGIESLDLSALPAPEARFSCHLPLALWRDVSEDLRTDSKRGGDLREAVRPHLDPRLETFLDPALLDRTSEFALSVWPDIVLGGDRRPVWLMGFGLDSAESAEGSRGSIAKNLNRRSVPSVVRTIEGVRVDSIETLDKDLHLATVGPFLLVSSNLRALQGYLGTQSRNVPSHPPLAASASFAWRIAPPDRRKDGAPSGPVRVLQGLGVHRVAAVCERLTPGCRVRLSFAGSYSLPDPPLEIDFDDSLIDDLPEDADFILWGAGSRDRDEFFSPEFPSLPALASEGISKSFAFGLGIPEATGASPSPAPARIAGSYRKPPPPIPSELLPEEIRPATQAAPFEANRERVLKLGEMELAMIDREDRVIFRNSPSVAPAEGVRRRLESLAERQVNAAPPVFVGLLSPRFLLRPVDLEFQARRDDPQPSILDLWPPLRLLVHPVDLAVYFPAPGVVEIELASTSLLSPLLVLFHSANLFHLFELGEVAPISQWLGAFGPLPASKGTPPAKP